jgi:hypothetical protein
VASRRIPEAKDVPIAGARGQAAEPSLRPGRASTGTSAAPVPGELPAPDALAGAWLLFHHLPGALGRSGDGDRARSWIDEWRLAPVVADAFRASGVAEADAWRAVEAVKALLTLPPWDLRADLPDRVTAILEAWLADESVARFLQVNVYRDVRWFSKEAFEGLATWSAAIESIRQAGAHEPVAAAKPRGRTAQDRGRAPGPPSASPNAASIEAIRSTAEALIEAAARSGYRLDALGRPFGASVPETTVRTP